MASQPTETDPTPVEDALANIPASLDNIADNLDVPLPHVHALVGLSGNPPRATMESTSDYPWVTESDSATRH